LSFSDLLRGSSCEELWSQGALKTDCMELKSEHACTTAVKTIEAINPIATSEKIRFDMSVFV
jgi:hypothetical protein